MRPSTRNTTAARNSENTQATARSRGIFILSIWATSPSKR